LTRDPVELGREVIEACRALGFALAGVTRARRTDRERELRGWLAAGKHGSMGWMEELLEERLDVCKMLPGARSVVMVGDVYGAGRGEAGPGMGRIARYARGRDYHVVMKRRLHRLADVLRGRFPREEFRSFVDTGPVLEREHAVRAGLGWVGKHTLLINPALGSYVLLGGMVTTLEIGVPPEAPGALDDSCGTCTRCIDACPTGAITPYSVDARRCISYLTIEHSGTIEEELQARMGGWLFGCDVCQEVCPYNRGADEGMVYPAYRGGRSGLSIAEVMRWGSAEHERAVRGTAMKRATLGMLQRNAAIVAGNELARGQDGTGVGALRRMASDNTGKTAGDGGGARALRRVEGGHMAWKKPRSEGGEGERGQKRP
jgi:epoxyqueuosine reductase